MKYLEAILVKFAMVFSVLFVILGAYGVGAFQISILSLIITAVVFIGDLIIYPKTSNKVATREYFVLVFLIVWLGGLWLIDNPDFPPVMTAIFSGLLIAVGEWFFHIYLTKRVWEQIETSHTLKQEPNRK